MYDTCTNQTTCILLLIVIISHQLMLTKTYLELYKRIGTQSYVAKDRLLSVDETEFLQNQRPASSGFAEWEEIILHRQAQTACPTTVLDNSTEMTG